MEIILYYFVFLIFFSINTLAISNIVLPFVYTIPRLKKEEANGNLKKKVPIHRVIGAPIIWMVIMLGIYLVINNYYPKYFFALLVSSVIAIFALFFFSKKQDMNSDFNHVYKEYLKE